MQQFNFTVNRKMPDGSYEDMTRPVRAADLTEAIETFKKRLVDFDIEYCGPVTFTVTPMYLYIIEGMVFDSSYGDWDQGYYEVWETSLDKVLEWWRTYGPINRGIDISMVDAVGNKAIVYKSPTAKELAEQQGTFSPSKNV